MSGRRPVYVCPGCKARIPFGTESEPPPDRCPECFRRLWIPSVVEPGRLQGWLTGSPLPPPEEPD